ncbi:Rz1-like lysis system protein LysC [Morganella morganii]|uniref:Rz1-like lysis system protein LysC n=1 Tax=Morganella morganii TaxID=582 RepID=UPI003D66EBA2
MSALLLLFPLALLGSCSNTKETYVPAPVVPIPPHLTADCEQVVIPDELTYGGAILLLADAMKSIADCNHDKRSIREIEAERAK